MRETPRNTILTGDAAEQLATLPEASIDCVVTSPPYYNVRNYGMVGQLGQETNVDGWVEELRVVCAQLARVLKPSGSLWLNVGDAFSRHERYGAPAKSLLLGPERLTIALQQDGWLVRGRIVWAKSNPMPSSVTDRPTLTYEFVYFLTRSPRYFFDLGAIREPHTSRSTGHRAVAEVGTADWAGPLAASRGGLAKLKTNGRVGHPDGRNPGDVWRTATSNYRGAHAATFPPSLIRRPILATCPQTVCEHCGLPWRVPGAGGPQPAGPSCSFDGPTRAGIVMDPFLGAGTVGLVAEELGRDWLGIELNPDYVVLAEERIRAARTKAQAA
jgi:site-specific DNA-methyltransferase (adenine-specific)